MKKQLVLFGFLTIALTSCPSMNWFRIKRITEHCAVTWGDYYDSGDVGYTFRCDLCADNSIQDIKSIRWNNQLIIIEKNLMEQKKWYAIINQECFGHSILGPLNRVQIDSIAHIYKQHNFNEEVFIK